MLGKAEIIAASRFGMGASPFDEIPSGDAHGWLAQQIDNPEWPAEIADAPSLVEIYGRVASLRQDARKSDAARQESKQYLGDHIRAAAETRLRAAISSRTSFVERWVWFWSNHFTISRRALVDKIIGALAGPYERESIRQHAFGRFRDMLTAAIKSPAMALYLDNISSIGPNSKIGLRKGLGLNENLGREILELHTLGVNGGYTQDDVKALAAMLSGWSFGKPATKGAVFEFRRARHEPGPKTLLDQKFAEDGLSQGERALAMLASHPSTARHVATKLARHFIADQPPKSAVDRLTKVFLETDGDLKQLALAVIGSDEAWGDYPSKIRTPLEFLVAVHRASEPPGNPKALFSAAGELGQVPFNAPSPAGWADTSSAWAAPDGMVRRVEYAMLAAGRMRSTEAQEVLGLALGPFASKQLKSSMAEATSREALALVFASPEFQRR